MRGSLFNRRTMQRFQQVAILTLGSVKIKLLLCVRIGLALIALASRAPGKTGVATTFLTMHDTEVFYDLKQILIHSNSPVPHELAKHEASKFKPGSIPDRPPRRNDTAFTH